MTPTHPLVENIVARVDFYVTQLATQADRTVPEELLLTLSINARRLGRELLAGRESVLETFAATVHAVGELRDEMLPFRTVVREQLETLVNFQSTRYARALAPNDEYSTAQLDPMFGWQKDEAELVLRERLFDAIEFSRNLLVWVGSRALELSEQWEDAISQFYLHVDRVEEQKREREKKEKERLEKERQKRERERRERVSRVLAIAA